MLDYCKPLANKKPDLMILHVGPNDLSKKINHAEANLVEIISTIKEISLNHR